MQEETVSRGRFTGRKTRFRFFIAADKYNWIIARLTFDKDGEQTNEQGLKFYSNFRGIFRCLLTTAKHEGLSPDMWSLKDVFNNVNSALAKKTGKPMFVPENQIDAENFEEAGLGLTRHYGTDMCSVVDNPGEGSLTKRLFK
tara:strand:- start:25583 stop:26008 length:426 start_codon:yes stop_codon:yes gene_type:complete